MFGKMVADMMINRADSPVFNNPSEFGLEYEDVKFKAKDGVELSGWLIKGNTDKIIVQSHFGIQCSRAGYTPKGKMIKMWDKDVSFLRQAKYLVEAGYSVLMYDFRNHGESGTGSCEYVTWGVEEAKDVAAAVDYVSNHPVYKDADIGLLSICMGSGSSTYAFGKEGLGEYKNIKAMISVQPLNYSCFVNAMKIPKFMQNSAYKIIEKRTNLDFHNDFMPYVQDIPVPTMVLQNTNDPWTSMDFVNGFYDSLNVEKEMVWMDLKKNRGAAYDEIGKNSTKILEWFGKYLG